MKTKQYNLENLMVGQLVAFKNGDKMISAKVTNIYQDTIEVESRNGSVYFINREEIAWVKTGSRWPTGIYNALKINERRGEFKNEAGKSE